MDDDVIMDKFQARVRSGLGSNCLERWFKSNKIFIPNLDSNTPRSTTDHQTSSHPIGRESARWRIASLDSLLAVRNEGTFDGARSD